MRYSIRALALSIALILVSGNGFSEIVNWEKLLKESVDDEGYAKPGKGIDIIYTKPASEKEWGEIVADQFGLDYYKKSYAFVVGISRFRDGKAFETLNNAKDSIRMAKFLADEAGYDYVHLLSEEKAGQQRIKSIMLDTFRTQIDENDTFLFYWSGHGTTVDEKGFFPLFSSNSQRLSSMIAMDDILDWDKLLKAKQAFYLLDSCFSGLATTTMSDKVPLEIEDLAGPSRHIFMAGTKRQETIALKAKQTSIFTMSLLEGLQGNADGSYPDFPPDGVISAREL